MRRKVYLILALSLLYFSIPALRTSKAAQTGSSCLHGPDDYCHTLASGDNRCGAGNVEDSCCCHNSDQDPTCNYDCFGDDTDDCSDKNCNTYPYIM